MARSRVVPPPAVPLEEYVDPVGQLEDELDRDQAAVGTLIALESPEMEGITWSIFRLRTRAEIHADTSGQQEEWVADREGPLRASDLQQELGGGTFHFLGYVAREDGRGKRIKINKKVALTGPRKDFNAAPPPPPAAPATPPGIDPVLKLILENQQRQLDSMNAKLEALRAPASSGLTVDHLIRLAPLLKGEKSESAGQMFQAMMTAFDKGLDLGAQREPSAEPSTAETVMKYMIPALEKVATVFASRVRVRAQAPVPRPPAAPSSATVVEPEPAAPNGNGNGAAADDGAHRWTAVIEAMARAIVAGKDARDFAPTVADILEPAELFMVRGWSVDQLIAQLKAVGAMAQYPVLDTPQAQAFLAALLEELRNPSEDETPETP